MVDQLSSLQLAELIKQFLQDGVYSRLPQNYKMWEFINQHKVNNVAGTDVTYKVQRTLGAGAVGFRAPTSASFPTSQHSSYDEGNAYFKDFYGTISVPREILVKSKDKKNVYADPYNLEVENKASALKRRLAHSVYGDGTGSVGLISAVAAGSGAYANKLRVTLNVATANAARSNPAWFVESGRYQICDPDSTVKVKVNGGVNTVAWFECYDIDIDNNYVYFTGKDSSDDTVAITSVSTGDDAEAADYIYHYGEYAPNIDGIVLGTTDMGTLSYAWPGLESLAAIDGRKVNALTMSQNLKGSLKDAGTDLIDIAHMDQAFSKAKRINMDTPYMYKALIMHDIVLDLMAEHWRSHRLVTSEGDNTLSTSGLKLRHRKDVIEFVDDSFCPLTRMWSVPEGGPSHMPANLRSCLHFFGSDIAPVSVDNVKEFLQVNSSGQRVNVIESFVEGSGLLYAANPSAIVGIYNFAYTV